MGSEKKWHGLQSQEVTHEDSGNINRKSDEESCIEHRKNNEWIILFSSKIKIVMRKSNL